MSGAVETVNEINVETYEKNIKRAASVFEKENIIGLIEPINPYSVPKYYMNNFHKGSKGVMWSIIMRDWNKILRILNILVPR